MSYRVRAHDHKFGKDLTGEGDIDHQIYGNNEFPNPVSAYIISQGCEMDEDGCFFDFEITDINGFLDAMLAAHNEYMKDDSYWDFKPPVERDVSTPYGLITHCMIRKEDSYAFIVYNFYSAFRDILTVYWDKESNHEKYKIKEGKHVYLSGF